MDKLKGLRSQIDALDEQLQTLINERARCAQDVATLKQAEDVEQSLFYHPAREAQVLRQIKARNQGPLPADEMARLFREIMSSCLALEQPMTVGFLGPAGSFTQAAALKHFGHAIVQKTLPDIPAVFREVEAKGIHYGVVPIENSTEGVVNHTLDSFVNSSLKICGEVELPIHHHLLVADDKATIKRIYSHSQSFAQCREWLDQNYPGIERVTASSNAQAALQAKAEAGTAAIAGVMAAELYGLTQVAQNIEDYPDNTTRFLIIGDQLPESTGDDKTTLLIWAPHKPGALADMIKPFGEHSVNMTRIESRPSRKGLWQYFFFVDIEGHVTDPTVIKLLDDLTSRGMVLKVLGTYPRDLAARS